MFLQFYERQTGKSKDRFFNSKDVESISTEKLRVNSIIFVHRGNVPTNIGISTTAQRPQNCQEIKTTLIPSHEILFR